MSQVGKIGSERHGQTRLVRPLSALFTRLRLFAGQDLRLSVHRIQEKIWPSVVMTGNDALGYGLIAAGVRFGAAYPITPWSDIMELFVVNCQVRGTFVQCEDEIASVCMALGSGWAGQVAVTGSSGPGISLKTEGIGWASWGSAGGGCRCSARRPSTGMPPASSNRT